MEEAFIEEEDFNEQASFVRSEREVYAWKELSGIFRIIEIHKKTSVDYGTCYLMKFEDKNKKNYKAWCPSLMLIEIEEKLSEKFTIYFSAEGQKKLTKIKSVNLYDLVYKPGKNTVGSYFKRL